MYMTSAELVGCSVVEAGECVGVLYRVFDTIPYMYPSGCIGQYKSAL